MRVLVLGSGVIGVTSAYYLAKKGFEVTVLDRQAKPALETSYANAGQISPGYASPWAAPGVPFKAFKWLFQKHSPLILGFDGSLHQLKWMSAFLQNCNAASYQMNKSRMVSLAEYSRDCLDILREETHINYESRTQGTLQVFRKQKQLDAAANDIEVLKQCGVAHELLDRDAITKYEPALALVKDTLMGGLRLPRDETGDCHLFTQGLADEARKLGVNFHQNAAIQKFIFKHQKVVGVEAQINNQTQLFEADHIVIALGSFTRALLQTLSIDVPIYPVKGYSLTIPIINPEAAPVSTVMDETYKVAITRFDQRIRVGGIAELAGFNLNLDPKRRNTLEMVTQRLFPNASDLPKAEFWCGLRPMTPDGTPIIGRISASEQHRNVWINSGHGTLGWTMSCGSGSMLVDLIAGQAPAINASDYTIRRR